MKFHTKRFLSLVLAFVLSISLCVPAFAAGTNGGQSTSFTDVGVSHWAYEYIQKCCQLGIVNGYSDGTFGPDNKVTGSQFVTMVVRTFYGTELAKNTAKLTGMQWYVPAMVTGNEANLFKGTAKLHSDSVFFWKNSADLALNRYDMAQVLSNLLSAKGKTATTNQQTIAKAAIKDWSIVPDGYQTAVLNCYALNIIGGHDDGSFGGSENMTRAQACVVITRMLDLDGGEMSDIPVQPVAPTQQEPAPTVQEQPMKSSVAYTTDKLLYVAGIPLAGMVVIDNEYYFPLSLLRPNGNHTRAALDYNSLSDYEVYIDKSFNNSQNTWIAPITYTKPGIEIGMTEPVSTPVKARGVIPPFQRYELQNALRMLGDVAPSNLTNAGDNGYYLLRLSALPDFYSYREDDSGVYLLEDQTPSAPIAWETDLAGQALKGLIKGTSRETVQAIHDYLVNTLTYDNLEDSPKSNSSYYYGNNKSLSSGYAICDDYSSLFQAMCLQAGIPCMTVRSVWGLNHSWNRVYVDGKWYYIDVTWDDPVGSKPTLRQKYFLSETLWSDHQVEE